MKSVKLQLLVTLAATVVAAGVLIHRGLPPRLNLYDAVNRGDIVQARRALAWGTDPNFTVGRRHSNLSNALTNHDEAMVRLLIAYGADVNAPVIGPRLPFQLACGNHMPKTAKLLILAGQDVNRSYRFASSPLQCASVSDYPELVTFILQRGAAPDRRNDLEWTALHEACFHGKLEAVRRLIAGGADVNIEGRGVRPIHLAIHDKSKEIVDLLVAHGASAATPVTEMAMKGQVEALRAVLARDPKAANAADPGGWMGDRGMSALQWAAAMGHTEAAELLIRSGASVAANRHAALHYAAQFGRTDVVRLLIEKGADVNAEQYWYGGYTPLTEAARFGHTATVVLLIAHGADVNWLPHADSDWHDNPLCAAAEAGNPEVVTILLDHGAQTEVSREGSRKWVALVSAVSGGHIEVVKLLLDRGADVNADSGAPLQEAVESGNAEMAELLLTRGANANAMGPLGRKLLTVAISREDTRMAALLRRHGARE